MFLFSELSQQEVAFYEEVRHFVNAKIMPFTNEWEIVGGFSREAVAALVEKGFLAGSLPDKFGGLNWDMVHYGLFTEALSRASVSLAGLCNVQTMVALSILRWGSPDQRERWLPDLVSGKKLAAIALTEPQAGSDLRGIRTKIDQVSDGFCLNGTKQWITCGALADLILVFGLVNDKPSAVFVETHVEGVRVVPNRAMLGFKAAHLASLVLNDCLVPRDHLLGRIGAGQMFLAPYALEYGRISVAWEAVGILGGCLEVCGVYAAERVVGSKTLAQLGMIQSLLTEIGVGFRSAFLMALQACRCKDREDPAASTAILAAKYHACRVAACQASNAVQIMGAKGCDEEGGLARFYRDAKILEIIEGSNQVLEFLLSKAFVHEALGCFDKNSPGV